MAIQPPHALYSLYGFVIWGDIGPLTMYRRYDGRIVSFIKTWPKKPGSGPQKNQRNAIRTAAAAWNTLTAGNHLQWNAAASRASLCMNGYDLFVHYFLCPSAATLATLQRQTGIALALPPWPTPPSIIGDFEMGWYWNKLWYTCARSFNAKKDPAGDPDYYIDAQQPGFPRHELYVRLDRIAYRFELGITFYRDSEMWPSCTANDNRLQRFGAHAYNVVAWHDQNPASLICTCSPFIAMPP